MNTKKVTKRKGLYRKFFEATPVALFVYDEDGRIVDFNAAACDMHGYDDDEMMRLRNADLFASETESVFVQFLETLMSGQSFTGEAICLRKNGERFPALVQGSLVKHGSEKYLFSIVQDVSEQRAIEKQLRQSEKMRALGQLTGGVAHDFNNLLMVVQGNAEILEMSDLTDDERDAVELIQQSADQGGALTKRLLSFSGESDLNITEVPLREVLDQLTRLLLSILPENITFRVNFDEQECHVLTDKHAFETALINIIMNARDAMPNGGNILVSCDSQVISDEMIPNSFNCEPGQYCVVAVSDDGPGMGPETVSRALEPFFTTKGPHRGTGLGLSMAYGLARQSGGEIKIYSEVDKGTTVNLYLPSVRTVSSSPSAGDKSRPEGKPGAGEKILIVEDEAHVRQHVDRTLTSLGYRTIAVENADAARQIIESETDIALLFTDVMMPGSINGYELAQEAQTQIPGMRVLLTSGYPAAALKELRGQSGDRYEILMKPYRRADLKRRVSDILT